MIHGEPECLVLDAEGSRRYMGEDIRFAGISRNGDRLANRWVTTHPTGLRAGRGVAAYLGSV